MQHLRTTLVTCQTKCIPPSTCFSSLDFCCLQKCYSSVPDSSSNSSKDILPISKMPGLRRLPFIGSVLSMMIHKDFDNKRIHKVFTSFVKEYGPIMKFQLPGAPPAVGITKPEDVETMFRVTMNNPIRKAFICLKKIRNETVDNYFENKGGILTENDEEWWRIRSKVQTPMLKPSNVIKYLPQMDEVTLDFIEIIAKYQNELGEMPSNFLEEIYKWALESVCLVALNKRLGCLKPNLLHDSMQMQIITTVNTMFEYMNIVERNLQWWRLFPTPTFKKLKNQHDLLLRIADENVHQIEEELRTKRTEDEGEELTLVETLLNTEGLTRKDVVTMILDMMFAGIDTTSHTLGFALYLLARNRGAQNRLQEEIDSVLGDGKEPITRSQLARLSFLKACVKETLRIFPLVFGNTRVLEEDTVFSGYLVPKGIMHRFNVDYKYEDMEMAFKLVSVPSEPLKFEFSERKR